jgi:hypothetical protein
MRTGTRSINSKQPGSSHPHLVAMALGLEEKQAAGGKGQPKRKRAESPIAKKEATQAPRRASQGDASRDKGAQAVKKETSGKPAPVREAGQPRTQEPQNGKRPR